MTDARRASWSSPRARCSCAAATSRSPRRRRPRCAAPGYLSEVLVTPQNRFGRQLSAYLSTWLTDVGETADGHPVDQVISLRFPSYAVRHRRHVCWLNHRMREYYDLWERFTRGLGRKGRLKEGVRRRVFHALDRWLLTRNVTRLVAQSRTIQARLQRFGGIPSELLYPPAAGAAVPHRRLRRLRLRGLAPAPAEAPGPAGGGGGAHEGPAACASRSPGEGEEGAALRERIRELGLQGRVELLGAVSDAELVEHYARCRAVYFAPWNEDYGFVTLEAFRSGKAVITTTDSGGPAELVRARGERPGRTRPRRRRWPRTSTRWPPTAGWPSAWAGAAARGLRTWDSAVEVLASAVRCAAREPRWQSRSRPRRASTAKRSANHVTSRPSLRMRRNHGARRASRK